MTSDWKEEELAEAESAEAQAEDEPAGKTPKRRIWPLPLLLLIIAAATFAFFAPETVKERYLAPLKQWLPEAQKKIATPQPTPAKPATPQLAPVQPVKPLSAARPAETAVEQKPVVVEKIVPASSEEINRVLDAMQGLQGELNSLRRQQKEFEERQREVQIMQLRTRLNWIANPANHLPQLQLAWEEISLMPVLNADERQQAKSMLALAQKSLLQLQGWQQIMQGAADSLTLQEHDNVIPVFENSWLNWIAEQFSVRPSLSQEEADDAKLRESLLDTSRRIEMEQWPSAREWLELRSKLQLRLLSNAHDQGTGEPVSLELPESFDAMRADIETLRSTAAVWLERL